MIRPLRRRHPWLVGATAALAGPLYLAALAARPAPAVQEALPPGLAEPGAPVIGAPVTGAPVTGAPVTGVPVTGAAATGAAAAPGAASTGGAVKLPTTPPIRLRPVAGGAIEATADGFVEGADLLLYWAPRDGERQVAEAYLLGAPRGGERQVFDLPAAAAATPGVVILYSLGHGEELARADWPAAVERAP